MRLKRVSIFGFKTFAERTEFELQRDLVAVVGPNGCGKSNLVDAILWGLGEGSAKNLRAHTGADVIFNGSANRKPLGYAEVTLLFDNEDGALPIATAEVGVTRRVQRDGVSDYRINGRSCRLKDVLDLLADSGLGRSGYSIVGQREIDQALSASPEERRAWVDEAAGVQRYRARKQDALRRLASAQQHLDRVSDILAELDSTREPLRAEAEAAREYKRVAEALRSIEVGVLVRELTAAQADLEAAQAKSRDAGLQRDQESARADEARTAAESAKADLAQLGAQVEQLRSDLRSAESEAQRWQNAEVVAEQRLRALEEIREGLFADAESAEQRVEDARADGLSAQTRENAAREELEALRRGMEGSSEVAGALSQKLAAIDAELAAGREHNHAALRRQAERDHAAQRASELRRELAGISASLPEIERALAEADAAVAEAQTALEVARKNLLETEDAQRLLAETQRDQEGQHRALLTRRASLEGRAKGVRHTLDAHEGLQQGAKAVMDAFAKGRLQGTFHPLGSAVEAHRDWTEAIEAALGAHAHDLVVHDPTQARDALKLLAEGRLGRATLQPLATLPESSMPPVPAVEGVVGRASEFVSCPPEIEPVVRAVLGRVLLVESLEVALTCFAEPGFECCATRSGEVVTRTGALSGGISAKPGSGLVHRRAELAALEREVAALAAEIEQLERALAGEQSAAEEGRARMAQAQAAVRSAHDDLNEARSWASKVRAESESTVRAQGRLQAELDALPVETELPAILDLQPLELARDAALSELAAAGADARSSEAAFRAAEERLVQARAHLQQATQRLAAAEEANAARTRRMENLGPERARVEKSLLEAQQAGQAATLKATGLSQNLETAQARHAEGVANQDRLADIERAAREAAQRLLETIHSAELARTRADSRRTAAAERLIEEYGITEDEAAVLAPTVELPSDALQVTRRLRSELRAMGEVNLGAIEAFERLSERADTLIAQRNDIVEGMTEIEKSMAELDGMTRERFERTLEQVSHAFGEVFQVLFGGGEGTLRMTDPSDRLGSGIELDVTLPGKKRQRLELLSGGERSLCATAFLFALLRVKPSPFVVLDEVDAPLDGRNVERFVDLLKGSTADTQFMLVTHNPSTIEAAPAWLGVTMKEPGVSVLIPASASPPPMAVVAAS